MAWNRFSIEKMNKLGTIVLRAKEAVDMKNGFTSGMLIGGIVGATMSMIMNHDIDVNKTKKRMMRMGRNMYRRSRRIVSDISDMMH
jgi:hypothetical protein